MRLIVAAVITVALARSAAAQDRVIGLLSLPEVYGARVCAPFEPGQVALHPLPKIGTPTAFIRVDQNWSFAPHGGCEGLKFFEICSVPDHPNGREKMGDRHPY